VGVVVDKGGSVVNRSNIEPASNAAEGTESAGRHIRIDADLHREGERPRRVHRVVNSTERQANLGSTTGVLHGEILSPIGRDHVDDAVTKAAKEPKWSR